MQRFLFGNSKAHDQEKNKEEIGVAIEKHRNCLRELSIYSKIATDCLNRKNGKHPYCDKQLGQFAQVETECSTQKSRINYLVEKTFRPAGPKK